MDNRCGWTALPSLRRTWNSVVLNCAGSLHRCCKRIAPIGPASPRRNLPETDDERCAHHGGLFAGSRRYINLLLRYPTVPVEGAFVSFRSGPPGPPRRPDSAYDSPHSAADVIAIDLAQLALTWIISNLTDVNLEY